ncbi:MAG: LicD family protein [Clostridiales bacterium]|nr:LicD family protein [Clostridiales bacterium]
MKREQEGLLLLLKEIDTICKNNGITYYVSGGTVIGAVRHEGFIPWDDDIDVYMTRDNWNKFRKVMKTQTPEMRALVCWEDDEDFNNLLGRYMNKATTQIHQFQLYNKSAKGQLVDMFVLDPIIDDDQAIRQYQSDVMLISDLMSDLIVYSKRANSCDEYAELRDRITAEGRINVISELIGRLEKYNEEESDYYILRWGGIPHVFPKEMFAEPKYLQFEDMNVPVPSKVCEYLVQLYGLDWMYIPPHDEQLVHTGIFDSEQPYERFTDLILPRVKNTETEDILVNRKKELFSNLQFTHELHEERMLIKGDFVRRKVINQVEEKGIEISNSKVLRDTEKMRPLMKDYIRMQSHRDYIGGNDFQGYYRKRNPIFVDIGDELFAAALRVMIQDGRISKADRLIQVRQQKVKRPMEPYLDSIQAMINGLKEVQTMFEFNQLDRAEELLKTIVKTESNIEVYKYLLELIQRKDGSTSERFNKLLEECLAKWPDDGDFLKYKGDALFGQQDYQAGIKAYTNALLNSNNGLFALLIGKSVNNQKEELLDYLETIIQSADGIAATGAWKTIFVDDTDISKLYLKTHINGDDPFANLFRENACIKDEETVESICSTYAEILGWSTDNVRFVLADTGLIKGKDYDTVSFDDKTDISKYLNAVILQKNGDVREAYKIYLELLDSKDRYVAKNIRSKLENDHKLFIKMKTEEDDHYFQLDYALKYGDMPYEEFLKLLKVTNYPSIRNTAIETDHSDVALNNPWFKLLVELIQICERNDIQYMLGGAILQYLIKDIGPVPNDFSNMELIMDGTNAQKLIKACHDLPEDRNLECVLTNPRLRNSDMLYINTASTGVDFSKLDRRRSLGIAVPVRIARPQVKSSRRMTAADFDKFWLINYGYPFRVLKLNDKRDRQRNRLFTIMNKNGDKATLKNFRNILKQEISKDTKIIYVYGNVTRLMHKAILWKERKPAELFGVRVVVPSNIERYLNANYHTDSKYYDIPITVVDETYVDHVGEEKIYSDEEFWKRIEDNRKLTFTNKDQSREHKNNWEMANNIYEGITIQDRLLSDFGRLKRIYDKGAYTELLNQMDGYKKVLKLEKKYDIDIDSELEKLYLEARKKI